MGIKYFESVKNFYLIGVGGISMSGIARHLLSCGYGVRGSDVCENGQTEALRLLGAQVFVPHHPKNLTDEEVVIYSSAIDEDNCELAFAKDAGKMIFSRAEFIRMISLNFSHTVFVAGSHGKTTATAMIAHIFDAAGKNFCAHIGGEDLSYGNFTYRGDDYFIGEACEYKKNILNFKGETAVLLNSDADHMECYKDKHDLNEAFSCYLDKAKYNVVSVDALMKDNANAVTFSMKKACYYPENIQSEREKYSFDLIERDEFLCRLNLGVYGEHNILNALAASAVARLYGISGEAIKKGIEEFRGVKRRFETVGKYNGAEVVCDYAHHPKEIAAVLQTAKKLTAGKLFVVFQPHTYTRTFYLMDDFVGTLSPIEKLLVYRTYAARENYMEEGSAKTLFGKLKNSRYADSVTGIKDYLSEVKTGDMVLALGAGDIYHLIKIVVSQNSIS